MNRLIAAIVLAGLAGPALADDVAAINACTDRIILMQSDMLKLYTRQLDVLQAMLIGNNARLDSISLQIGYLAQREAKP